MKNKKVFTLIEIIICIGVLAVVGVVSFVGINYVSNNIRINKLKDIEDEILTAAKVYLETNNEANDRVFSKKQGVIVPLKVLVNEGLLDLTLTDLDIKDVGEEYVYTSLSNSSSATNDCIDLKSVTSWNEDSNNAIYVCSKSNGESNLVMINPPNSINNLYKVSRENYYFKGESPDNYVKYNNYLMRIISVQTDDSILVAHNFASTRYYGGELYGFKDIFNRNQSLTTLTATKKEIIQAGIADKCNNTSSFISEAEYMYSFGGLAMSRNIYNNITECYGSTDQNFLYVKMSYELYSFSSKDLKYWRYIYLKPCMKITNGTGTYNNPYLLEATGECK